MDKINGMRTFCRVVKEGGFSAAARKLGTSKVMVSRNVSKLEDDLGLRLLQRTTRKMSLTEDGLSYYERCLTLLEEFDELENSIKDRSRVAKGRLKLSVPSEAFTSMHLVPFFSQFSEKYPELQLDITLADRYVDIIGGGFDAAVRIGTLNDSSIVARKLASMKLLLCASPPYLDQFDPIAEPKDLNQHNFVMDTNYRDGQSVVFSKGAQQITFKAPAKIRINSPAAVAALLKQGLGLGICPSFIVTQELKENKLCQVLPEWEITSGGIYVIYSHRLHLSLKVRLFVRELADYFENRVL